MELLSHIFALLLGVSLAGNIALSLALLAVNNRVKGIGQALRYVNKRKTDADPRERSR